MAGFLRVTLWRGLFRSKMTPARAFLFIDAAPTAEINRASQVLLVWRGGAEKEVAVAETGETGETGQDMGQGTEGTILNGADNLGQEE